MSTRYLCCEHCMLDSEGNCADGLDSHLLPCPELCDEGVEVAPKSRGNG